MDPTFSSRTQLRSRTRTDGKADSFEIVLKQMEHDVKSAIVFMRKTATAEREKYWSELDTRDGKLIAGLWGMPIPNPENTSGHSTISGNS